MGLSVYSERAWRCQREKGDSPSNAIFRSPMPGAKGRVQLGLLFSLLLVCSSPDSHSQDTKTEPFLG